MKKQRVAMANNVFLDFPVLIERGSVALVKIETKEGTLYEIIHRVTGRMIYKYFDLNTALKRFKLVSTISIPDKPEDISEKMKQQIANIVLGYMMENKEAILKRFHAPGWGFWMIDIINCSDGWDAYGIWYDAIKQSSDYEDICEILGDEPQPYDFMEHGSSFIDDVDKLYDMPILRLFKDIRKITRPVGRFLKNRWFGHQYY